MNIYFYLTIVLPVCDCCNPFPWNTNRNEKYSTTVSTIDETESMDQDNKNFKLKGDPEESDDKTSPTESTSLLELTTVTTLSSLSKSDTERADKEEESDHHETIIAVVVPICLIVTISLCILLFISLKHRARRKTKPFRRTRKMTGDLIHMSSDPVETENQNVSYDNQAQTQVKDDKVFPNPVYATVEFLPRVSASIEEIGYVPSIKYLNGDPVIYSEIHRK